MKRGEKPSTAGEPNIFLGSRCNQRCLFCSEAVEDKTQTEEQIRFILDSRPQTLSIEGGEPSLARGLDRWVRAARESGVQEIVLCTNAAPFLSEKRVEELCEAGLTLFNVNFPAHRERLFDLLTQTRGQFSKRVAAIKNIIRVAGGEAIRLNMVVNTLNYMILPEYVRYVREVFREVFYVELNLVKTVGRVIGRPYLVPRLTDVKPYLKRAMDFLRDNGIHYITDGFPLCHLKGHEEHAIDAYKLVFHDDLYLAEKTKTLRCAGCALGGLCAGPRRDYVELYGDPELRPSRGSARRVLDAVRAMERR